MLLPKLLLQTDQDPGDAHVIHLFHEKHVAPEGCLLSHTGQIVADVAPRLRLVPQDVPRAA